MKGHFGMRAAWEESGKYKKIGLGDAKSDVGMSWGENVWGKNLEP